MAQPTRAFPDYWTEADLASLPDDGHRYEIVDGSLLVTPRPKDDHQGIGMNLAFVLRSAIPKDWRVVYVVGVRVPGGNFVPDLVVLKPGCARGVEWREAGDAALVVEIASPSTRLADRTLKAAKYAEAEIPAYWRVERDGTVTIHSAPAAGEYTETQVIAPGAPADLTYPFPVHIDPSALID